MYGNWPSVICPCGKWFDYVLFVLSSGDLRSTREGKKRLNSISFVKCLLCPTDCIALLGLCSQWIINWIVCWLLLLCVAVDFYWTFQVFECNKYSRTDCKLNLKMQFHNICHSHTFMAIIIPGYPNTKKK